jgi:16S rRNA (guanine966-N2)-methyltransferase
MSTRKSTSRSSKSPLKNGKNTKSSVLRIIGGQWRSRRLSFIAAEGLRPTTDRVRETLFNWISPNIPGAKCLDLFTGSGALGLEALSREARSVTFIDLSPGVISSLKANLQTLQATNAEVACTDSIKWLKNASSSEAYDIIFIDPPFRCDLVPQCVSLLESSALLKVGTYIYVEIEKETTQPQFPQDWRLHREKEAGQVRYMLFINQPHQEDGPEEDYHIDHK